MNPKTTLGVSLDKQEQRALGECGVEGCPGAGAPVGGVNVTMETRPTTPDPECYRGRCHVGHSSIVKVTASVSRERMDCVANSAFSLLILEREERRQREKH